MREAAQPSEESKVASEILVEPNIVSNEMLIDILKASGVVEEDIETQITQLTAIPQTVPDKIMADETQAASQDPQQKDLEGM